MNKIKIFSKSQFSILWWSGSLSSFGDWATLFASVALASQLGSENGNSGITAVVPVIARIIPAFLSSFAGLMADRMNKKNIMIFTDLSRMVIVLFLFFANSLLHLFIINFLTEIFSLMRQPSRESVVPELVDKENLVKANSLFAIGTYATLPIASIFFALIADIRVPTFITSFGNGWSGSIIFLFDSITFMLSAYLLLFLKTTSVKTTIENDGFVLKEFKEGLNYFFGNKEIRNITVSISLSLFGAYSSVAYQGVGRGLGYEKVYELNDFALSSYWPEKVVLLDIDPEISLSRQKIADRIGSDKVSFFNKVRDGYLQLAEDFSDKFLVINAEDSKQENFTKVSEWLDLAKS